MLRKPQIDTSDEMDIINHFLRTDPRQQEANKRVDAAVRFLSYAKEWRKIAGSQSLTTTTPNRIDNELLDNIKW